MEHRLLGLHNHTSHSDGRQSFSQLLQKARSEMVTDLVVTDHESVGFMAEFSDPEIKKLVQGINIYPGTELEFEHDDILGDTLVYGGDLNKLSSFLPVLDPVFKKKLHLEKIERFHYGYTKLGFKLPSVEELLEFQSKSTQMPIMTILGGLAQYKEFNDNRFKEFGAIERHRKAELQRQYITSKGAKYEIPSKFAKPTLDELHIASKAVGGKLFFAHPNLLEPKKRSIVYEHAKKNKIFDGIEVYYPGTSDADLKATHEYAIKNNLLISGGTDSHTMEESIGMVQLAKIKRFRKVGNIYQASESEFKWLDEIERL